MSIWSPVDGDLYWTVSSDSEDRMAIRRRVWEGSAVDKSMHDEGQVFPSKKLALAATAMGLTAHDFWGTFDGPTAATLNGLGVATSTAPGQPGRHSISGAPSRRVSLTLPEPLRVAPAMGAATWVLDRGPRMWSGSGLDWEMLRENRLFRSKHDADAVLNRIAGALADA